MSSNSNAKKDWIEALRQMCDALEPLDDKEREKVLRALYSVYDGVEMERLRRLAEQQR